MSAALVDAVDHIIAQINAVNAHATGSNSSSGGQPDVTESNDRDLAKRVHELDRLRSCLPPCRHRKDSSSDSYGDTVPAATTARRIRHRFAELPFRRALRLPLQCLPAVPSLLA